MSNDKTKKYTMDMCEGPILKKMLIFSVPLIFSSILQLLFNAADIIVVGKFAGDNSLAAVGSTSSLINLFVTFFIGMSVGVNVLVARYYGAKQKKNLSEIIHTAVAISLVSGVILAIIGIILAPTVLKWMNSPQKVIRLATIYLRVYFVGMPAVMLYNFGAAILRAIGDTKRPMFYLIIAGIVNVTLNLFFVIVLEWGVFGVGVATTISQVISATLVMRCLMKESEEIRVELRKLHINKEKLLKILQIGLPAGIQGILFSISNVLIQSSVNAFGEITVAGNSAAANIEGFVYVAMNAFYQATITFTSQNIGAGKYNRINRILLTAQGCVTVVGIVLGITCYFTGPNLLILYTSNPKVVDVGMIRLTYIALPYVLCGIMDVMVGCLRGMGYAMFPMIVSLVGVCGLRILWLQTIFKIARFHVIETVYAIYPISWLVTIFAHIITYLILKKKFVKR